MKGEEPILSPEYSLPPQAISFHPKFPSAYFKTILDVNGEFTNNVWTTYDGGAATTVEFCLADGCATMFWTEGSYVTETAFTITDADGNVLASGEDGILSQSAIGVNDDSCVTYGCTDDTATNFNPDATAEDGSCEYDCDTWLDTEELYSCYYYVWVNPIYTVEEATSFGYDCTCVEDPVYGCMDDGGPTNTDVFNNGSNISGTFLNPAQPGTAACNYNSNANVNLNVTGR